MKTTIRGILLCLFVSITISAEDGWFWQNPTPQGNVLLKVFFVNENVGWASGGWIGQSYGESDSSSVLSKAVILKTTDGGNSWFPQQAGIEYGVSSIFFINENTGWAACGGHVIIKTTDGGEHWEQYTVPSLWVSDQLNSIYFTSENIGYALSGYNIFKTIDGGVNWIALQKPAILPGLMLSLYFTSDSSGIVSCAKGTFLKTSDGGDNWSLISTGLKYGFESISFASDSVGWAVTGADTGKHYAASLACLLKTTDCGNTWSSIQNNLNKRLTSVFFISPSTGCAVSHDGVFFKTTDGGINWIRTDSVFSGYMRSICMSSVNRAFAVGQNGAMVLSTDGGNSWINKSHQITASLNKVFFVNPDIGWVGGEYGVIYKTTDGGNNWRQQVSGFENGVDFLDAFFFGINYLYFKSPDTGWAIARARLIKTTDGGSHWYPFNDFLAQSIYFLSPSLGWAAGFDGNVYKSIDGGETWTAYNTGVTSNSYSGVFFQNDSTGWVVGENSSIFKTTDGGETWIDKSRNGTDVLTSVRFTSQYTGWIDGIRTHLKTTDGGETWAAVNFGINESITSTSFISDSIGWASAFMGSILKTTDGGSHWRFEESPFKGGPPLVKYIYFISKNEGWAVGKAGVILKTNNGGGKDFEITTPVEPGKRNLIKDFAVSQNFPNPFNPATTIRFDLPQLGKVSIKIYNLLGKEIAVLLDDIKSAGSYSVVWNGKNSSGNEVSTGVYFYSISFGNTLITKKMLLLR